eukprot:Skav202470  [mRNA]  locus=scaffold149:527340:527726:- [translate_table: standard]
MNRRSRMKQLLDQLQRFSSQHPWQGKHWQLFSNGSWRHAARCKASQAMESRRTQRHMAWEVRGGMAGSQRPCRWCPWRPWRPWHLEGGACSHELLDHCLECATLGQETPGGDVWFTAIDTSKASNEFA